MHPCLSVDEILRLLASELVASEAKATAVALASCCKSFEDPVLDASWEAQDRLVPLLKCFPQDVWEGGSLTSFKRIPTKAEWIGFCKYARRMRDLMVDPSKDPVTSDLLFALQLRTAGELFLPRLKGFMCEVVTEAFAPFIPLLLSPQTTWINVGFAEDSPTVMAASMIARLPTQCPNLEWITLNPLPRNPVITEAVSEMLLACNRNTLRGFCVDSPLTEEARRVVYQLPKLSKLWVVIQGRTLLPPVALPNLTVIDIEFDDHLDWLRGFRGLALDKLEGVYFSSESGRIGNFLGEFEKVALTTSASTTLSTFTFTTSSPWNPNFRSLLPFTQLQHLVVEFSCDGECSSRVDDDIIVDLVRAMPKLEVLKLGGAPCGITTGVTVKGLIMLACGCRHLSELCIHFQTASLVDAATSLVTPSPSEDETAVRQQDCALKDLKVGEIPIQEGTELTVTVTLLQIFPRLFNINFTGEGWGTVAETIRLFKRVGTFVRRTGDALDIGDRPEDGRR